MLSEKCFVVFYVFSFPAGVYVGTLNLIVSTPDPSIFTLFPAKYLVMPTFCKHIYCMLDIKYSLIATFA